MYILGEMKQINDIYSVDEVNCLEKPLSIMLNSFNPLYRSFYLLFQKMIQSYNLEYYHKEHFRKKNTMGRSGDVLGRELGIQLYKVEDPDDFFGFINGKLAENNPVIVPVNLRELYYSTYYNKADWIHSFLIFGHNEKNKLYDIFDSTQRHDEGGFNLYKFVVKEDTLYHMHKSFCDHIYKEGIYYVISKDISLDMDLHKYLYKCIHMFCNSRMANAYVELDIIDQILIDAQVNQKSIKRLMRICHYKKVFYSELEVVLKTEKMDTELLDKYITIRDKLLKIWVKISGKIMYYLYKKMPEKVEEEVQQALVMEADMLSCMNNILKYLQNSKVIASSSHEKVSYINNLDNIISRVFDNEFIFEFNNGKIYNNWFKDCAPKVVFSDIKDYSNFTIRSKFILEEYTEGTSFVLGIYLKDNTGSSYIFGLNSGVSMLFEHTGVNNAVLEMDNCSNIADIEIKISNKQLYISYMLDEKSSLYKTQTKIKGNVISAGICCKTWGVAQKLRFRVKNIEIDL